MSLEVGASSELTQPGRADSWPARWQRFRHGRYFVPLCLVVILLVGGYFRFTGVNWDDHTHLHPDERHIWMVTISLSLPRSLAQYFNTAQSPLNPYNQGSSFIYGTLPLFLTKALGEATGWGAPDRIHLLGRVLAATSDLFTVVLMFLIGRKLYDERVGLLGALLTAGLVIHIQQSHFYTVDGFVATFVILTFYRALWVVDRGSWSDFLWMGVSYGLAVASKINVALFGLVMALACALRIYKMLTSPAQKPAASTQVTAVPAAAVAEGVAGNVMFSWQKVFGRLGLELQVERAADAGGRQAVAPVDPAPVGREQARSWLNVGYEVALKFAVSLVVAVVAFRIVQPYSFQGPGFFGFKLSQAWLDDVRYWSRASAGEIDLPFSHQWASRTPILFSLQNMVLWAVGVPLGLASWAGWAFAGYELLRKRKLEHLLVFGWTTFIFLYQSTRFAKLSRYLTPFFPFMAMLAAYLVIQIWDRARRLKVRWATVAAVALAAFVTVGTLLWAFAFTRIYTRPLTRVSASLWVYDNIPPGSAIGNEHWDDAIPWGGVGGRNGYADGTYEFVEFHPYHEDLPEKLEWFVDWLTQADYLILSSNRLYGSIPRLPMRYPMTTRYYDYLFKGQLGFELIKTFTSRPNLGPIEFVDDNAEEPFTVYDHPKVQVFRKTEDFSGDRVRQLLGEGIDWENIARLKPIEVPGFKNGLQMTEEEKAIQRQGGTWSDVFDRKSLSNVLPVVMWLLLVELLGVVTLPLSAKLFQSLADRGYALSKTLGILLLTWVTWMLVNLGLTTYSRAAISLALLLVTACSGALFWRQRDALLEFLRRNRRLIVVNELLFLLFFTVFLLVRYGNPDLWHPVMGGEKPMDFAYLNAVVKSSVFPPYDPWYAGGYLNYYYYGQIIVATLIKLTGIVPWVAYNLAIPLLAALTAMGAFCVVYNLTANEGEDRQAWWKRPMTWALFAALLTAVLGNLGEIGVWLKALRDMGTVDAKSSIGLVTDLAKVLSGAYHWLAGHGTPGIRPEWPYWNPSRIMTNGEINEFPFFTFLYADLHAHLIALPFTLLALGVAVSVIRRRARSIWAGGPVLESVTRSGAEALLALGGRIAREWLSRIDWGELLLLGLMGLVVGALRPINSWDYPTYLLVSGVALALREYEARQRIDLQGLWAVAWRVGLVVVLSYALYWPFISRFATAYMSIQPWKGPRTSLSAYLVIHGLFLWVIMSWLGIHLFGRQRRQGLTRMLRISLQHWDRLPRVLFWYRRLVHKGRELDVLAWSGIAALALAAAYLVWSGEWFYLFIVMLILGTLVAVLRWRMQPVARFAWLLFGLGLALSLGVDLVVLKGDIGRMNTVFKFYLQIWVMWSVVAAVALSQLVSRLPAWRPERRRVWWGVFAFLVFLSALYPVLATRAKINDRFDRAVGPTLNGMAYMERAVYYDGEPIELQWDLQAINWLLDNVEGSPVIAEANTEPRGLYRWGSRISIYTGLPTIIGWSWHQRQQRSAMPNEWIDRRLNDVQRLYADASPSVALDILRKYEVRYVYVGEVERVYYPASGLDKFETMRAEGLLRLAYHNERVRIYEVLES